MLKYPYRLTHNLEGYERMKEVGTLKTHLQCCNPKYRYNIRMDLIAEQVLTKPLFSSFPRSS